MTQHLGTPPRPWAGLETHLYAVADHHPREHQDIDTARRRRLAALSLALGYLARKRAAATTDAG
ncbi:MAG: hypothetical protein ACYCZX_03880 [Rhodospirillaceae bacterium]